MIVVLKLQFWQDIVVFLPFWLFLQAEVFIRIVLFELRFLWQLASLIFDAKAIKHKNLVEEEDALHDQEKSKKFLGREDFMAKSGLEQKEEPNHEDSALLDDRSVGGGGVLRDADTTAIEHRAASEEGKSVQVEHWHRIELLDGNEDVICVVVDALVLVEWAWVQLGRDEQHQSHQKPPDTLPSHHV